MASNAYRIRTHLFSTYNHLYSRWSFEGDTGRCFYCDESPSTRDHVPPLSWADMMAHSKVSQRPKFYLVPCCTECNSLLSDKPLNTLFERTRYIEKRLMSRYERNHVLWTPSELAQMSRTMRVGIKAKLRKNEITLDRVRAVQKRLMTEESFPED